MNLFKKTLRLLGLIILIILAISGIAVTGDWLPNNRERYKDKRITMEQVDKEDDEDDD